MRLRRKLHRLTGRASRIAPVATLVLACLMLGGCVVASAVTTVVLLPIKIVGAGIDAVVTTDAEADEKRGRQAREAEEKASKAREKQARADAKAAKAAAKDKPGGR